MFKKVMGLIDKIKQKEAISPEVASSNKNNEDLSLNIEETKILLHLIKNSNFKGDSVEIIYNLTLKLQKVLNILS